jgi:formate dehydrogenase gamma subunit
MSWAGNDVEHENVTPLSRRLSKLRAGCLRSKICYLESFLSYIKQENFMNSQYNPHDKFLLSAGGWKSVLIFVCLVLAPGVQSGLAVDNDECLACHSIAHGAPEDTTTPLVNMEVCARSVHLQLEFSCTDCHSDIEEIPHASPLNPVNCAECHDEMAEVFAKSIHGVALAKNAPDAPTCVRCHSSQNMLSAADPASPVYRLRIAHLCGECHSDPKIMREYQVTDSQKEHLYKLGVHAAEVIAGNENAPTCIDCHGVHTILPLRDPNSPTNFMNVSKTCGKCHETEMEQYQQSVHGKSAQAGHKDSPVCTDCHGEHSIFRVTDERSPVSFFNLAGNTCGRCHSSIVINEKFNIPARKVENYFDSYHGLALQQGSKKVANCGSCHGSHLILPSSDPASTVSPQRLVETCGVCHPGISSNVLAAPIHAEVTLRSDLIAAWVPRIYIPLIIIIIGGMLLHNGLIFWTMLREKFKKEIHQPSYQRFNRFEIICHIILTISFIVLVITGFALLSPNSWWVTMLSYVYFTETIRAPIHRIAGVALMLVSIVYALYMVFTRRGRYEFRALFLWPSDIRHAWQHLAFHLGKRPEPPKFGRYDYTEKMEFWALVWGVIIMAVTGLILWFPITAFEYLPKWAIDMARLIHYYEAVLATLAIVVWHFFFVIFHPEEYPMSVTWLTGKMTKEHLKHRHTLEYEELYGKGKESEEEK